MFQNIWYISDDDDYRDAHNLAIALLLVMVLGSVSLPIYKDIYYKSQLTELFTYINDMKYFVHEYYITHHTLPPEPRMQQYLDSYLAYLYEAEQYLVENMQADRARNRTSVSDIAYVEGSILFTIMSDYERIDGEILRLQPVISHERGSVLWFCGRVRSVGTIQTETASLTTLPPSFLVGACRD